MHSPPDRELLYASRREESLFYVKHSYFYVTREADAAYRASTSGENPQMFVLAPVLNCARDGSLASRGAIY